MEKQFEGRLVNEFGEAVGKYWFREGANTNGYVVSLYGHRRYVYSLEGVYRLADRLSLYVVAIED